MTQVVNCPGCSKEITLDDSPQVQENAVLRQQINQLQTQNQQIENAPKADPHEELAKNLPTGVNFTKCSGRDCGHKKIENLRQITKYKACPNCRANTIPKNSDFCPTCGLEENSRDFDEWDDSDIEIEND